MKLRISDQGLLLLFGVRFLGGLVDRVLLGEEDRVLLMLPDDLLGDELPRFMVPPDPDGVLLRFMVPCGGLELFGVRVRSLVVLDRFGLRSSLLLSLTFGLLLSSVSKVLFGLPLWKSPSFVPGRTYSSCSRDWEFVLVGLTSLFSGSRSLVVGSTVLFVRGKSF